MKPNTKYWPFKPHDLIQQSQRLYVLLWWERIPGPYEDIRVRVWDLSKNTIYYTCIASNERGSWSRMATPD